LGLSKNTVKKYIQRSVDEASNDENVKALLAHSPPEREADIEQGLPKLVSELGRVGVTRRLLWEEYIQAYPKGYSYRVFCRRISQYRAQQGVTIRIERKAAENLSIDFTGKKISWVNKSTGEVHQAEVLVCTMPYSGFTFACALPSQKQEHFIEGINQALIYIGGLPKVLLSDNLKSFVIKADRYEPTFNQLCV
jgi:transposase